MAVILLLYAITIPAIAAGEVVPLAIAQQQEEDETSLDEDLAGSIISYVLDGGSENEKEVTSDANDSENVQDAMDTATKDSSQEQDINQDDISTFGDDTADLDVANVGVPIAIPINVGVIEEEPLIPMSPPAIDDAVLPEDDIVFCVDAIFETNGRNDVTVCFITQSECEEFRENPFFRGTPLELTSECYRLDAPPAGCEPIEGMEELLCVIITDT